MAKETKPVANKEQTFDALDIRVGKILEILEEPSAPKLSYRIKVDFGKFGVRTSIGRFTQHSIEELLGQLVVFPKSSLH